MTGRGPGRELIGRGKHWEQSKTNEANAGQVCREGVREERRLGRSTETQEGKQTTKNIENTSRLKKALNASRPNTNKSTLC